MVFSVLARSSSSRTTTRLAIQARARATIVQKRLMGSDMPVPQSQNAPLWGGHSVKKEGWEETWYFYLIAGTLLQAFVITSSPETTIESWARPEAKARLKLATENPDMTFEFGTHYRDVVVDESEETWTKFSDRATIPGDDDDDDDDDEDEVSH